MRFVTRLVVVAVAAVASVALAQDRVELNTITSVQVSGGTISIVGNRKPNFTTFTMTDPPRLVIDISEAVFSGVAEEQQVGNGVVTAVRTASYGSDASAIARVLIGFEKEYETDIQSNDTSLVVKVLGAGGAGGEAVAQAPAQPADDQASARAAAEQAAAERAAKERAAKEQAEADRKAAAEAAKQEALAAKQAAEEEKKRKAEEAAAEREAKRQEALAAKQAAAEEKKRKAEEAAAEREAKRQEALAAKQAAEEERKQKAEEAAAEREAKRQESLAAKQAAEEERKQKAEEAAAEREARRQESLEAKQAAAEEKRRLAEEAAAEREAKRQEAQAAREQRLAMAESRPSGEEESSSLSVSSRRKTMTFVGFRQEPGGQRVYVRTDEPVRYSLQREGDKQVVLELENTTIGLSNNTRVMDTSYFNGAVAAVRPQYGPTRTVRIEITLKENVPYEAKQEGNEVFVDFQTGGP